MNFLERPPLGRRTALRLLLSGVGVTLLAACAPAPAAPPPAPPTPAPPPTTAPTLLPTRAAAAPTSAAAATSAPAAQVAAPTSTSPATGAPRKGGTLRVGQIGDIVNLDPHIFAFTTAENTFLAFDRLTAQDLQGKPTPQLAESWDVSSDAKQVQFKLRPGVQFHTGRELTSADVKFSVERVRDPKIGLGQFALQGKWFQAVETPDKFTVVLKSDQPRPLMFDFFEYLNIADSDALQGPDAQAKLVGTGPFKLMEWVQGDHITFQRNPNYWQSGAPYLDTIRTTFLADAQTMSAQFEADAADLVRTPAIIDFVRLKSDSRYQAIVHPSNTQAYGLYINTQSPPLDDKRVRQALNYALDRERFVNVLLRGVGKAQDLPWSETYPMYEAAKMNRFTFDLDKAKSLLADAGVTTASVDILPYPATPEGSQFAELYQADLAKIGVKLNIMKMDTPAWTSLVNSAKYTGMYFAPSTNLHLSPGTLFNVSRPLNPNDNNENFKSDRYTQLVSDAGTTTDPARLKDVYSQLNDVLLDESFAIYLSPNLTTMLARKNVRDVAPNMHAGWSYTTAWIDA